MNMKMTYALPLITAASLAVTTVSAQAAVVPNFSATYKVQAEGITGTATRTLTKQGNGYRYSVKGSALGASINQSSDFTMSASSVVPSKSSSSTKFLGIGNTHSVAFNGAKKSVASTYKGKTTNISMPRQAYDDLSLEVKIRQELMAGKFSGSYPLVKRTNIENTKFKKAGTSKITVPAGTYEVLRIDRVHDDKDRTTSFWLAPSLDYLPVKVSQTDDGKVYSMELTKIN